MSVYLRELGRLTPASRAQLKACLAASPNGCRDETCSPPCYARAGLSFDGWREFVSLVRDQQAAAGADTP